MGSAAYVSVSRFAAPTGSLARSIYLYGFAKPPMGMRGAMCWAISWLVLGQFVGWVTLGRVIRSVLWVGVVRWVVGFEGRIIGRDVVGKWGWVRLGGVV